MIRLIKQGKYLLAETKRHTRMLVLDEKNVYAWIHAKGIGEILVSSHKDNVTDHVLAVGEYRLYEIRQEKGLSDQIHLELLVGKGMWQGYLLPNGLPTIKKKRNRIIPTKERITYVGQLQQSTSLSLLS